MPPAPSSNLVARSSPPCEFPPIFSNIAVTRTPEPNGFLPWVRRIRREKHLILEWNNAMNRLQIWYWPVVNGQRVPPSDLNGLRLTHVFRGPSCLCSMQTSDPNCVTEAAIFLITTGRLAGEYAAACAQSKCKFWIFLERLYPRLGLPIRACTERLPGSSIPAAVEYIVTPELDVPTLSQESSSSSSSVSTHTPIGNRMRAIPQRPAKRPRTRVSINENVDPFTAIPNAPPTRPPSTFNLLMQLDSVHGGGLSDAQFRSLFVRCSRCRMIATATGMRGHICSVQVIDLTGNSDD
ncbi:hypothetical protein BJ912DRAFT_934680 [Pholiota molesta]|nr:hypothetical protein BJ912DRAFT_934680 [Pholiota molesta]